MEQQFNSNVNGLPMPLVAVLTNPHSTTNKNRINIIRETINDSQNVVHFELRSINDIDEALLLFSRANPSMIIINAGDGTVGAVLAALLYRNPFAVIPPIAILPGGKTNMTAADLGWKGPPEKALKQLLLQAKQGILDKSLVKRHLIELDLGDGSTPKVGTFFGAASIVKSMQWCRDNVYPKGISNRISHFITFFVLVGAALGLVKRTGMYDSKSMRINVLGGGHFDGKYGSVSCTTLDKVVLGLKPYSLHGKGALKFSCVEAHGSAMYRAIKGLFTGKYSKSYIPGVHVRRSDKITIETEDVVTLDGEFYVPKKGNILTLRGDRSLIFVSVYDD